MNPYPEVDFGGFTRVDGTVLFYTRIDSLLQPTDTILDVGCGRGSHADHPISYIRRLRDFRGRCATIWGCDVDVAAEHNPTISRFFRITNDNWQVPTASVDLAIADFVLEHISDPDAFFGEAARVLKPGAHLCIRTPNAYGYVATIARLVPNSLHARVCSIVQRDRLAEDVFPTVYRCNTVRAIRKAFCKSGFDSATYSHESEPSYLGSGAIYRLGAMLGPLTPSVFRNSIHAFGRKT